MRKGTTENTMEQALVVPFLYREFWRKDPENWRYVAVESEPQGCSGAILAR